MSNITKRIIWSLLLLACSLPAVVAQSSGAAAARAALKARGASWQPVHAGYQTILLDRPLAYPGKSSGKAAQDFLQTFGPALGWDTKDTTILLKLAKATTDVAGQHHYRFQQYLHGWPVLGGACTVTTTRNGAVKGFTGRLLPRPASAPASAPPASTFPLTAAKARVTTALAPKYPHVAQWDITEEGLLWASENPWATAAAAPLRLTRIFTVSEPGGYQAERVYLDAASGELVFHHQLHCELNRRLYYRNTAGFNLVWQEGNTFPGTLAAEDQELLLATSEFYNLMFRTFGRQSYDGANGEMRGVTNATLSNCPNANARGNVISHCAGVVGDDIVGHEWTHNYIRSMNGLIYAFESGAINEGFADIFGESLDLLNDRGTDTNDQMPRTNCDENNLRWHIAEDATAIDTTLRDLWFPECKADASSRESPHYVCATEENDTGGVHTNSGLVNRTFSLLTDGGMVGEDTIRGLGLTKALHIFHHANNNYVTQVTDFYILADILVLSATDLIGVNLPALTLLDLPTVLSDAIITTDDVLQLQKVIGITQLRGEGPCPSFPALDQNPPEICAGARINAFGVLLTQDWEDGLQNWEVVEIPVVDSSWDAKPWSIAGNLPDGRPGLAAYAPSLRAGDCETDFEHGVVTLTSPAVSLPQEESEFVLSFDHYFATQEGYDGGVLYFSLNDGPFALLPNQAFLYNGYTGRLVNRFASDNPLAGLFAFHGQDRNSTSGTWGQTIIDLTTAGAQPGDELRLQWVMGHDGCEGLLGWYIDDIRIGYCGASALPVSYTELTATPTKDHIRIAWATAREENNDGFYLERRGAEAGFREIAFIPAGATYAFQDYGVETGRTYVYRLRQQDLDGSVHYSDLVSATLPAAQQLLHVYPNPATTLLRVQTSAAAVLAELYSFTGQKVGEFSLAEGAGSLDVQHYQAGVYLLRVGSLTRRVILK